MKELPILYKSKNECCGCEACRSICPKNAIEMKYDKEGFNYPFVIPDFCIRCYWCLKVCPFKID